MQSRRWNYHHGAHFPNEKTELKGLDQDHTPMHVKSQAQIQGNSPQIVCVFTPHPLGVVGGNLAPMLRQKKGIFRHKSKKV